MEYVKKYGVAVLCVLALIALFLPMASVEVNGHEAASLSGLTIAFQGYICMLLIVGPIAILAADFFPVVKKLKALAQAVVSVLGIILTFVGYLQASNIASAGQSAGMGYVDCEASLGFGGILCLIAYAGLLAVTLLFDLSNLKDQIRALSANKK